MSGGDGDLGGAVPGEESGEEADGACAQDEDPAFDLEPAQCYAPVGAGHGLYEGGEKGGEGVGDGVEGVGGDVYGLGEAAGFVDADELHVGADIGGARPAVVAVEAGVQGLDGVEGVGEAGTAIHYRANDLVAHDDVVLAGAAARVDVEVGAADAAGADGDAGSARGEGGGVDVFHDHASGSPFGAQHRSTSVDVCISECECRSGGMLHPSTAPRRGTLTPFIPLSLRANKGEGEIRIGARVCAKRTPVPLIRY